MAPRLVTAGAFRTGSGSTAIHWVRGHFKQYTAERPLFGRFTGLYWWQPHLAGKAKDRVVVKDYRIEVDPEANREEAS